MIYYLIGLNSNFEIYFRFVVIISLLTIFTISFGLSFDIVCQDFAASQVLEIGINLMFLLFSGAFINQADMPVFLRWLTWLSPAFYAFNAIFQDQYSKGFPDRNVTDATLKYFGAEYIGSVPAMFVLAGMSCICQIVGAFELERRLRRNLTISNL